MDVRVVEGNLLDQPVEVIVNSWNRNFIPWWLLLPQGVSGAIKKQAGLMPFTELSRKGLIPLGGAVATQAGQLPYKAIIHVAGINAFWFATRFSIQQSVRSAMTIVNAEGFKSVAFPLIGSGTGMVSKDKALRLMLDAFDAIDSNAMVTIVKFVKYK